MVELVGIEPTTSSLRTMRSPKKPQFGVHLTADYAPKRSNSSRLAGSCLTTYRWLQLDYAKNRGASPDARGVTEGNRREHARTTARVHILTPAIFAGSCLVSTLAMAKGWCSPALPLKVHERSNPFGPWTFISQLSFSREPTMDTRQSTGLLLRACSTSARISAMSPGSPVLCSSSETGVSSTDGYEGFG